MISKKELHKQLDKISYNYRGWGRSEVAELPNILLKDEEIFELVNGLYDNGFALLVATDIRVLLIDKKPLNFLTVEDLRFDMINEMDYSHRLLGAEINISAGNKNLSFRSYNQPKLRKLIGHVQNRMAEAKRQDSNHLGDQTQHLENLNQQLQAYLITQHEHQEQLHQQLLAAQQSGAQVVIPPAPAQQLSPELSDYLFAQSLLKQHQQANPEAQLTPLPAAQPQPQPQQQIQPVAAQTDISTAQTPTDELYSEGMKEVFGQRHRRLGSAVLARPAAATRNLFTNVKPELDNVVRPHDVGLTFGAD